MKMTKNTDIVIDIPIAMTMATEANKVVIKPINLIRIGEAQIKIIPKTGILIIVGDPLVVKTSHGTFYSGNYIIKASNQNGHVTGSARLRVQGL